MLAAILALIAAALFAVGSVTQSRAAAEMPADQALKAGLLLRLIRRPLWLAGIATNSLGYVFHAAALAVGAVVLVQPMLTTTLLFALPLSAKWAGRTISRRDLVWAIALVLALAAFVIAGEPGKGVDTGPIGPWLISIAVIAVIVGVCVGVGASSRGARRAALLGAAAGILFGTTAPLTKTTVDLFGDGLGALFTSWEPYALVVIGLLAVFVQQSSYQVNDFAAAYPPAAVLEPFVGSVLGVVVLDEALRTDDIRVAVILVSVVVMIVATITLARTSPAPSPDVEAPPIP